MLGRTSTPSIGVQNPTKLSDSATQPGLARMRRGDTDDENQRNELAVPTQISQSTMVVHDSLKSSPRHMTLIRR
jgi:hypothetical protein